jgi:hypothetical protein
MLQEPGKHQSPLTSIEFPQNTQIYVHTILFLTIHHALCTTFRHFTLDIYCMLLHVCKASLQPAHTFPSMSFSIGDSPGKASDFLVVEHRPNASVLTEACSDALPAGFP